VRIWNHDSFHVCFAKLDLIRMLSLRDRLCPKIVELGGGIQADIATGTRYYFSLAGTSKKAVMARVSRRSRTL